MTDYPLYHITAIGNLERIVETGTILCKNELEARGLSTVSIAHQQIQDRRARWPVPLGPGGVLHDYVPFYFCPRSPMLFAIYSSAVQGCAVSQSEVLHLVTSVATILASKCQCLFTDGHAAMNLSRFFADPEELVSRLDYEAIESWSWHGKADQDRPRRKQAETLVHHSVPWTAVRQIGVCDDGIAARVNEVLQRAGHRPRVMVQERWYYSTS